MFSRVTQKAESLLQVLSHERFSSSNRKDGSIRSTTIHIRESTAVNVLQTNL